MSDARFKKYVGQPQPELELSDLWLIRLATGEYLQTVESTGLETVKLKMVFGSDRLKAKAFTWEQLKEAHTKVVCGFSGTKLEHL